MIVWWTDKSGKINHIKQVGSVTVGFPLEVITELSIGDRVGLKWEVRAMKFFLTESNMFMETLKESTTIVEKLQETPSAGESRIWGRWYRQSWKGRQEPAYEKPINLDQGLSRGRESHWWPLSRTVVDECRWINVGSIALGIDWSRGIWWRWGQMCVDSQGLAFMCPVIMCKY